MMESTVIWIVGDRVEVRLRRDPSHPLLGDIDGHWGTVEEAEGERVWVRLDIGELIGVSSECLTRLPDQR